MTVSFLDSFISSPVFIMGVLCCAGGVRPGLGARFTSYVCYVGVLV